MSLREGILLFPTKQSPHRVGVASGKGQERPRNDLHLAKNKNEIYELAYQLCHPSLYACHLQA
jgi:hypothetical protein